MKARYFLAFFWMCFSLIFCTSVDCSSLSKPKVAFLFLCYNNVYHQDYWADFLENHQDFYSVYIYSKNGLSEDSIFKSCEVPICSESSWSNTMSVQVELLESALRNSDNQKFVFVSESTIPIQDFEFVYNSIFQTEKSIFDYHRNPHQDKSNKYYLSRNLNAIPEEYRLKCTQWIILNRKHAELMVDDKIVLPLIAQYEADNELYPASFLAIHNQLKEIELKDMTYVNWEKINTLQGVRSQPYIFSNLEDPDELNCLFTAINQGYLFARKIDLHCDLSVLDKYLHYITHDELVQQSQ